MVIEPARRRAAARRRRVQRPGRQGTEPAVRDELQELPRGARSGAGGGAGRWARDPAASAHRRSHLRLHAAQPPATRHERARPTATAASCEPRSTRSSSRTTTGRSTTSRSTDAHLRGRRRARPQLDLPLPRARTSRNILEFEEAFPDATVILLEQNYRSTQTILDAANAVIANNLGRKPKELWTDQGGGEAIVRFHADDEGDEAQWVVQQMSKLHEVGDSRWGDMAVFYRTNAQSRVLEDALMRAGIPYKVDRRHPLLRPARGQGRAGLPAGGREPGRRGVASSGCSTCRSGASATAPSAGSTRAPRATASRSSRRCAGPTTPGVSGRRRSGASRRSSQLHRRPRPTASTRARRRCSRRCSTAAATSPSSQAEHSVEAEGRLENLAELVGAAAEFETVDEFLEQVSLVADTDELDADDVLRRPHDAALGEGPRVPGRVPHRHGGRRVPPPALARRARRARGGAPPRLRRHHPGPRAAVPQPRVEPHAVRLDAVQPAEPVPRRDPGRAGRSTIEGRRRPSRSSRLGLGRRPVERRRHAGAGRARAATASSRRRMRPEGADAERRRGARACGSATTCATASWARA